MLFAILLRPSPPPADPLAALDPSRIVAVRSLSDALPAPSPQVVATLRAAPRGDAAAVNWAGARLLRVTLAGGTALSLQVVADPGGAMVRVTADAPDPKAREAKAIRELRTRALRVAGMEAKALLGR